MYIQTPNYNRPLLSPSPRGKWVQVGSGGVPFQVPSALPFAMPSIRKQPLLHGLVILGVCAYLVVGALCLQCLNGRRRRACGWLPEWYLDSDARSWRRERLLVAWVAAWLLLWPVVLPVVLLGRVLRHFGLLRVPSALARLRDKLRGMQPAQEMRDMGQSARQSVRGTARNVFGRESNAGTGTGARARAREGEGEGAGTGTGMGTGTGEGEGDGTGEGLAVDGSMAEGTGTVPGESLAHGSRKAGGDEQVAPIEHPQANTDLV